jgi:NAD(P)-dependent dehydrogenase (short-subunit alcohol dehydrogenase family)
MPLNVVHVKDKGEVQYGFADVRRLVRETVQRFGRLDILVNNAGMALEKPLVETTEQEFDEILP